MISKMRAKIDEDGEAQKPVTPDTPTVEVDGLVKHFRRGDGTDVAAVDDVSVRVMPGTFTVLLGPSGCGKTTLLRSIGGLERPATGRITVGGRTVFDSERRINLPPEKRGLNMVFQSYALWPHMTAAANVAYPLACRKVPKAEIRGRVEQALAQVGIAELRGQYPSQMSGGQQQRVALARAIVSGSNLVLFDEPLSNVDAKVREQLRLELVSMQHELGFAALYVTHDQTEAMELADTIAVLESGRIVQEGSPQDIYDKPRTRYVADFIGTINVLRGRVQELSSGGGARIKTTKGLLTADSIVDGLAVGADVAVICRPERTILGVDELPLENRWQGRVKANLFGGSRTEHVVEFDGEGSFRVWRPGSQFLPIGTTVWIGVAAQNLRAVAWD